MSCVVVRLEKENPYHQPAGTSQGGEFAPANAGTPLQATLPLHQEQFSDGRYEAGNKLAEDLLYTQFTASELKSSLAKKLSEDLKDNPQWNAYVDASLQQYHFQPSRELVAENLASQAIQGWASTSSDTNARALLMQDLAAKEFGLTNIRQASLNAAKESELHGASTAKLAEDFSSEMEGNVPPEVLVPAYRAFLRQMYTNTQADLASKGIKEVYLVRGMKGKPLPPSVRKVEMHAMSSFSSSLSTANSFALGGSHDAPRIMFVRIPASRILSTPRTGYGCQSEREFVVLGGLTHAVVTRGGSTRKILDHNYRADAIRASFAATNKPKAPKAPKAPAAPAPPPAFVFTGPKPYPKPSHAPSGLRSMNTKAPASVPPLEDNGPWYVDEDLEDADWSKTAWDLPPYKSAEFMLVFPDLALFRTLPVYAAAVAQGLIVDDEWAKKKNVVVSLKAGFDESQHPRVPAGSSTGGQFGQGAGDPSISALRYDKDKKQWLQADGKPVDPKVAARIKAAGVKPAYTNVHLNPDESASLQAKGTDVKGRVQYMYSKEHSEAAAAEKFGRLGDFNNALPAMRQGLAKELVDKKIPAAERDAVAVLTLIDKSGIRVGSDGETNADVKAYGASTLLGKHIKLGADGKIDLNFPGKSGKVNVASINDPALHAYLKGKGLKANDRVFATSDAKVRVTMKRLAGEDFSPKDFRTWHGTAIALREVGKHPIPKTKTEYNKQRLEVAKVVSTKLNNTPSVALSAYIDPAVFKSWGSHP